MKLWQCDWVPSSVADWLCRELDDRGIPGTTYTHTLLSLLHPYFCPHPVPKDPSHLPKSFINFECVRSILSASQPQKELEVLFEELEDHVHPDADFPELNIFENPKEKTRRSKKRQKRKLNQISLSPERIWKVAALQCLWTASDKPEDIEGIIEELFFRLNTNIGSKGELEETNLSCQEENHPELSEVNFSESCNSADFPPLSQSKEKETPREDIEKSALDWKTVIKDKLSPKKENDSSTREENQHMPTVNDCNTENVPHPIDIESCDHLEKPNSEMEIKVENGERGELKNEAYCFMPICREEPKFFDSEMLHSNLEVNVDGNILQENQLKEEVLVNVDGNGKIEEWECAGQLLTEPINRAVSVDVLGNRLYERSAVTSDGARSISNTGLNDDQVNQFEQEENMPSSVWSFSSESWTKPQVENLWNSSAFPSQTFDNTNTLNTDNLNSVLGMSVHKNKELNFMDDDKINNIHSEKKLSENWPSGPWNTFPRNSGTSEKHLFSSAQPAICEESNRSGNNFKSLAMDIGNESIKTIWSDYNDNITNVDLTTRMGSNLNRSASLIGLIEEEKNEENLCRSFNQLGLEHLWEDVLQVENKIENTFLGKNFHSDSPSLIDTSLLEDQTLDDDDDLYKARHDKHKDDDESFFIPKIPCGPTGPYVDLRHTESSGFSPVIPHDKNFMPSEDSCSQDNAIDIISKGSQELVLDTHLTTSEEENLLTSPRTHFRPIRQDSHGSVEDSKSEDSQGNSNALSNVQDSDLVFQRSGSGTLYLESDLLKGSPKKYMAYREPAKIQTVINVAELPSCPVISQPEDNIPNVFVPKFKLVNNEKFCQTEGPDGSENLDEAIGKEPTESLVLQNDIKKFDYLFKDASKNWDESYKSNIKLLWSQNNVNKKEAWELELGATANYPKWSTQDLQETNWSNKLSQFPVQDSVNINSVLNDSQDSKVSINSCEDSLSKIKFIWHSPKNKKRGAAGSSSPNKRETEISSSLTFPEAWNDKNLQDINYLQTEIMPLRSDLAIPKGPWNSELLEERNLNQSLKQGDSIDDVASRWQLQWEVDQEADEILGGLLPPSPLKSSPPYDIPQKTPGNQADIELNFLDFLESQDMPPPIEDLDNIEPNCVFNEGFAWGASSEEILQADDDDEGGREVLIYENEDGQTVLLPVEYLEDSLYDEIFGSVDTPIGGSLPDLPGGQMSEFKKGSLSLKLSRRTRGEKFLPPSKRPCSFFLEGNCRRSDCKFSHDLLTITCRFWVEGSCLKGETCPFRHGFPPPTTRRRNRSEGDQASLREPVSFASLKEGNSSITGNGSRAKAIPRKNRGGNTASVSSFEIDSETDFPCLGSSVESKIGSLDETSFGNVKVTKVSKKKKKFIAVTKALFNEVENELEKSHSKRGRRSKVASRSTVIDFPTTKVGSEATPAADFMASSDKKKGKEKECESLRKILRKRYPLPPQPPFSHEDGTLSDF